jgi:hypothetical protein
MSQEFRAFAPQVGAAPEHVTGGAHLGRVDLGCGEPATTQQGGHLWRSDLVVVGLAPRDGFHIQGMTADKGNALFRTQVGKPLPREDACNGHHQSSAGGGNGCEE